MNKKDYRSGSSTINYNNNNRKHADEYYSDREYTSSQFEYPAHPAKNTNQSHSETTDYKSFSPDRKHKRNISSASSVSLSLGTPRSTPRSSQGHEYLHLSPFSRYSSPERQPKHNRFPSIDYASELSPFPYYSPERKQHSTLSSTSYDGLFPNSAIKSPVRTPRRSKEKYVSFHEDTSNFSKHSDNQRYHREEDEEQEFSPFPLYSRKSSRYWDTRSHNSKPAPPKGTPARPYYRRYPPPPPISNFYLPTPKRRRIMNPKMEDSSSSTKSPSSAKEEQTSSEQPPVTSTHVIASDSTGVEVVLKQQQQRQQEQEKSGPYSRIMRSGETSTKKGDCVESNLHKNDTPRREKNLEKGKKVNVISPPEGQSHHGHNRSPSYNAADYGDLPSVPDSPHNPFIPPHHPGYGSYPPHHPGYQYAPTSPVKGGHKSSKRGTEDRQGHYMYSPQLGYPYPPPGYEENYRDPSPGKRQRLNAAEDTEEQQEQIKQEGNHTESDRYSHDPYQQHAYFSRWPHGSREDYAEPYDSSDQHSGHGRQKHGAPAVAKASSYPPPPSPPGRYDAAADSSTASYPGARRSHASTHGASSDSSYGHMSQPPRGNEPPPNHHYDYYESGYYPDPRSHGRYSDMSSSGGPRSMYPNYYYHEAPPHDEVHPLLRDYDPERDRRIAQTVDDNATSEKQLSPDRTSTKADAESVATTPSLKSRSSKTNSPSKQKPSTAAKAAIAAGMTQPPSAREVDFDIHNPPLEPVTRPSAEPVCSVTSNVNNNDVLCGRGGGTNTQIGNRRFRSLVQEFQPTYLLCRRKEKPLIARTIVLIIRHRGGRFLKKDDANGMLFEVGDSKAEAKTSQALREGLDVRASKSTTIMGRKKKREAEEKNKGQQHQEAAQTQEDSSSQPAVSLEQSGQGDDVTMSESPHRAQRDGPPQHEYPPYHPPHYFYGYTGQYPPYPYGYDNAAYSSPSRKRQRSPPGEQMYYPPPQYNHKSYPSYSYPPEYHYSNYPPPPTQQNQTGEDNSMWEMKMDFNPPRGPTKKEGMKREQ